MNGIDAEIATPDPDAVSVVNATPELSPPSGAPDAEVAARKFAECVAALRMRAFEVYAVQRCSYTYSALSSTIALEAACLSDLRGLAVRSVEDAGAVAGGLCDAVLRTVRALPAFYTFCPSLPQVEAALWVAERAGYAANAFRRPDVHVHHAAALVVLEAVCQADRTEAAPVPAAPVPVPPAVSAAERAAREREAETCFEEGRFEDAVKIHQELARLGGNSPERQRVIGSCWLELARLQSGEARTTTLARASEAFESALRQSPGMKAALEGRHQVDVVAGRLLL